MRFCEQCGTQLSNEARFCPACGQAVKSQPSQPQNPAVSQQPTASKVPGRALFLLLGIVVAGAVMAVLLGTGILRLGSEARRTVEGPGYASPEQAVRAYAEALKAGDMEAMLSTFAVESYVEHFDAASYWASMRSVIFSVTGGSTLLAEDSLTQAINSEARRAQIVQWIYYQYLSRLLADTGYCNQAMASFPRSEEGEMDELLQLLRKRPRFSDMTIGAMHSPEDLLETERLDSYLEISRTDMNRRIEWYGAQDMRDICLEVTIDGVEYYLFVSAARYGERWYNLSSMNTLGFYLGANSMSGGLVPVDEIEN